MMSIQKKLREISRSIVTVIAVFAFVMLPVFSASAGNITWDADTNLELSGSGITLVILSGSVADSLTVNASDFSVTVANGESFTVRYPATYGTLTNNGGLNDCNVVGSNIEATVTNATVTFTPSATQCAPPSSGGGGGGYSSPTVTVNAPNGGQVFNPGDQVSVLWSASGTGLSSLNISLSSDGGSTFTMQLTGEYNDGVAMWTVPDVYTATGRIKVEAFDQYGTLLKSDMSDTDFTINGTPPASGDTTSSSSADGTAMTVEELEASAPEIDATSSGSYLPSLALSSTPTINVDLGLSASMKGDGTASCNGGDLIKGGSSTAVYYCGHDGKRYVFPNERIFLSWFDDFSGVVELSDSVLASIPLGGNVTYRPGMKMIKIVSDPKTYAVSRSGLLRWVESEEVAVALYGADWNTKIDDIDPAFFFNYRFGDPITPADAGL